MRNLGPKSSAWLHAVGIENLDDVRRVGVIESYLRVKRAGFNVSLNLLWGLAGAVNDCPWNKLPPGEKQVLLLALDVAEHPPT
jgi:hypothetical protein